MVKIGNFQSLKAEEVIKALDSYRAPNSTQNIGQPIIEEFIGKIVFLMLDTYRLLKEQRNLNDENVEYVDMDDLGRLVALKLLRFNEIVEESLYSGDLVKMFRYWEDLAKLWWNIFNTNSFDKVVNKGHLLQNSILVFDKFFYIFFGAELKQPHNH